MAKKRWPIVICTWVDSCAHGGWRDMKDHREATVEVCATVGILLAKHGDRINIALSVGGFDDANGTMSIPRVAVKSLRRIGTLEWGK